MALRKRFVAKQFLIMLSCTILLVGIWAVRLHRSSYVSGKYYPEELLLYATPSTQMVNSSPDAGQTSHNAIPKMAVQHTTSGQILPIENPGQTVVDTNSEQILDDTNLENYSVYNSNPGPSLTHYDTRFKSLDISEIVEEIRIQNKRRGVARYLIATCTPKSASCGGMYDRHKVIMFSFVTALISGRIFGIKYTKSGCPFTSYFDQKKIKWNLDFHKLSNLTQQFVGFHDKIRDPEKDLIADVVYTKRNRDFLRFYKNNPIIGIKRLGGLYNFTQYEMNGKLIPYILPLGTNLQEKVNDFLLRAKPQQDSKLVCAHLRMGTNPTFPTDTEVRMGINGVKVVLQFLKQYMNNKHNRIFIAGDSDEARNLAQNMFPNQWVNTNGTLLHTAKSKGPELCEGYEKAIVEQRLFTFCDILVLSHSGFGRQGAHMRGTDENLFCYSEEFNEVKKCTRDDCAHIAGRKDADSQSADD